MSRIMLDLWDLEKHHTLLRLVRVHQAFQEYIGSEETDESIKKQSRRRIYLSLRSRDFHMPARFCNNSVYEFDGSNPNSEERCTSKTG